jgi:hypothetical protein
MEKLNFLIWKCNCGIAFSSLSEQTNETIEQYYQRISRLLDKCNNCTSLKRIWQKMPLKFRSKVWFKFSESYMNLMRKDKFINLKKWHNKD